MGKTLPAILIIVSLLMMNVTSAFHAHAADMGSDHTQIVKVSDVQPDGDTASHDCCQGSCHHHCGHLFVGNPHHELIDLQKERKPLIRWGVTYLSQLHYPPSRPPKA